MQPTSNEHNKVEPKPAHKQVPIPVKRVPPDHRLVGNDDRDYLASYTSVRVNYHYAGPDGA